ncbi:unnamed protein product [Nippostrongylus brasiliensis]|uniref:Uncharacterized protein n=1 Tax=Nippostrongylus brasiliensis TaxID=27835 RepID=A0A0N4YJ46_NIPBR|nr:unnamed protein product [Nippostrongylus brasiliensis]
MTVVVDVRLVRASSASPSSFYKLAGTKVPLGEQSIVSYERVRDGSAARLAVVPKFPASVRFDVESKPISSERCRDVVKFRPTKPGPNALDVYYGGDKVDEILYESHNEMFQRGRPSAGAILDEVAQLLPAAFPMNKSVVTEP